MIKNAKTTLFSLIFSLLLLGSCSTSDDNNPSPVPDARDKFVGQWTVNNEVCGNGKYLTTISKDPSNSVQVLIQNFAFSNAGKPDTAIVAGSSIVVYQQTNSEGWQIESLVSDLVPVPFGTPAAYLGRQETFKYAWDVTPTVQGVPFGGSVVFCLRPPTDAIVSDQFIFAGRYGSDPGQHPYLIIEYGTAHVPTTASSFGKIKSLYQ